MVTRRRKISAAALVLALGLCAAWPLRRTAPSRPLVPEAGPQAAATQPPPGLREGVTAARGARLPAMNASTAGRAASPLGANNDSAPSMLTTLVVTAGSAAATDGSQSAEGKFRIHVVHEGDRLDRLAKRYLGDESRALELFDLNREVLDNPHLLPIGAELRIPAGGSQLVE